jgi:uncharacterized protein (DUF362 family)
MTDSEKPGRRAFLRTGGAVGVMIGAGLRPSTAIAADNKRFHKAGTVVRVHHGEATKDVLKTNDEVVPLMVARALTELTGEADAVAAMRRFVKASDIVGIKINTLGSPHATVHPATAFAIAELVHKTGIPKDRIIIYDQFRSRMQKGKFRPLPPRRKRKDGAFPVHSHKTLGYETEMTLHPGVPKRGEAGSKLANISRKVTAVINVCCPKDHDLTGVTGALKNVAYGNIEYVPMFHCDPKRCNPICKHDGKCNVARVYSAPELGGKVRLIICDALRVLYNGGPQDKPRWRAAQNEIWASTDPVSVDRVIHQVVDEHRAKNRMKPVAEIRDGRRAPRFIDGAVKMGLGVGDLAQITQTKVSLT